MLTINATIRKDQGKGASRRLRLANKFPAIIYGGIEAPITIELDHDLMLNVQKKESVYSKILTLVIDGKKNTVKIQAVQRHPFKPKLSHIDFIRT
ncbi:50S ribosomal protein L25 [Candidatus Steffania adelgidicola]|uniref:50S ribosomal protein L25 n=1 Tax=Candidatus Steffania adelgidicola TaxID=1076626 RepID=UPI001D0130C2|nr:50S ribosomal protein L25 [Candidatus Steffania adelgidicola]UDG79735.1 50S ribosomal protein L25 [Candidatus Steffania adelgidicola]